MIKSSFDQGLKGAKNIGPTIEKQLNQIGVFTLADLAEMSPATAYIKLSALHPEKRLPVCYYLYSLQGALLDVHWDDLPETLKNSLRKQVSR